MVVRTTKSSTPNPQAIVVKLPLFCWGDFFGSESPDTENQLIISKIEFFPFIPPKLLSVCTEIDRGRTHKLKFNKIYGPALAPPPLTRVVVRTTQNYHYSFYVAPKSAGGGG